MDVPGELLSVAWNGSGWGAAFFVLFFVARKIMSGDLVPRSTLDTVNRTLETERARSELLTAQTGQMLETLHTHTVLLESIRTYADRERAS